MPLYQRVESNKRKKNKNKNLNGKGKGPWLAFIDIKEAFERVWHEGLFYKLWRAGIKGKTWRIIVNMYQDMLAFVRTNHGDTSKFPVKIGVLQGSVLAAVLFLIFIDDLASKLSQNRRPHHSKPIVRGRYHNCCRLPRKESPTRPPRNELPINLEIKN